MTLAVPVVYFVWGSGDNLELSLPRPPGGCRILCTPELTCELWVALLCLPLSPRHSGPSSHLLLRFWIEFGSPSGAAGALRY